MVRLLINGKQQEVDVAADTPLLWVLRDHVGLTGTKYGCGIAACGACTVLVDGQPVRCCITPASSVSGKKITTIEGLSPELKHAEFLNSDEVCEKMFKDLGWLPAYKPFLAKADPNAFPGLKFYFDSVNEATEVENAIACPIQSFVETAYGELREAVYRDTMTSADAAAEFQKRCETEYKNAGFK